MQPGKQRSSFCRLGHPQNRVDSGMERRDQLLAQLLHVVAGAPGDARPLSRTHASAGPAGNAPPERSMPRLIPSDRVDHATYVGIPSLTGVCVRKEGPDPASSFSNESDVQASGGE